MPRCAFLRILKATMYINFQAHKILLLSLSSLNGHLFESALNVIKRNLAEDYEVTSHILIELKDYTLKVGIHRYPSTNGGRISRTTMLPRRLRRFRLNYKRSSILRTR
jgi:hypothetical protein